MFGHSTDPNLRATGVHHPDGRRAMGARPTRPADSLSAVRLLLPEEGDALRDSRRTAAALVALVAIVFVVLNIVVYHNARSRLMNERWRDLIAATDEKRQDLDEVLDGLERDARFVANQEEFRDWVAAHPRGAGAKPSLAHALEFERRLDQSASAFDLLAIEMVGADGNVFANTSSASLWRTAEAMDIARRVSRSHAAATQMDHSLSHGKPMIVIAVPIRSEEHTSELQSLRHLV